MLPMQSKPSPAVLGVNQTQKFKDHNHAPSQSCSLAFFMPLFLPSDLIQTLLGFILAALELAIPSEEGSMSQAERLARSFQGYLCRADSRQEIKMLHDDDPLSTPDGGH